MPFSTPATMSILFLQPVFDALRARGCDDAEIARRFGQPEHALADPGVTVLASSVYAFLGWAADRMGDPFSCARIGRQMGSGGWAPILPLMQAAPSLAGFLIEFSRMAAGQGRAATYRLEVEGAFAKWQLIRPGDAGSDARFADAVGTGFFVTLLSGAAAADWTARDVIAVVPDAALIPPDILPGASVLTGGIGMTLRFPSDLLGRPLPRTGAPGPSPGIALPPPDVSRFAETVRRVIENRIAQGGPGIGDVAAVMGLSRWKLQALLRAEATTFSALRDEVRQRLATDRILGTSDSVAAIAHDLGYADASNFTRAVVKWTGHAPRDLRRRRQAGGLSRDTGTA